MRLTRLSVRRFRNLEDTTLELSPGVSVVFGQNGQGKTNLLEAIWFLAALRPLRGSRIADLVRFDEETGEVEGTVVEDVTSVLSVRIVGGRRQNTVDGKRPASIADHADHLKVVAFTPDDLTVAKGSPGDRRAWLDRVCFTRWSSYLADHRTFTHALKSRNRLVKEARKTGRIPSELTAFDDALAVAAAPVMVARRKVLAELGEESQALFREVTGTTLDFTLDYAPSVTVPEDGDAATALSQALAGSRSDDLARGFTTVGPQQDEVALALDGREVRTFASQGQQRAAVLAMKIAEIENLERTLGRVPMLLLDDISSELDPTRNAHLLRYLTTFTGQVVLTTTDPSLAPVPAGGDAAWFEVVEGRVSPRTDPKKDT